MRKNLMVMAVAGALVAPGVALGQTQIYGLFNAEYGFAKQPNTAAGQPRANVDGFDSGASRLGFRGEQKIGATTSAWYQCESQLNIFTNDGVTGWCSRNSALGVRGDFGNFYIGTWDSPIKKAVGVTRITNETGWLATAHILMSDDEMGLVADMSTRPRHTVNYDTPNFGGFTASFQISSTNSSFDAVDGPDVKGRTMGVNGIYSAGPLAVIAAFQKHTKNAQDSFSAFQPGDTKDTGMALGASYVLGPVKVGLTYTNIESDSGAGLTLERTAWNLGVDWKISGPGTIRFGLAQADNLSTNLGDVPDSGAKQYQISYIHAFTKNVSGYVGYVKVDNDNNGTYVIRDLSDFTNIQPGSNSSAFVTGLSLSF